MKIMVAIDEKENQLYLSMVLTKKSKTKEIKKSTSYIQPGVELDSHAFDSIVREAESSGYMTSEEFKKKCQNLLHTK
jgi:hypothetical protein